MNGKRSSIHQPSSDQPTRYPVRGYGVRCQYEQRRYLVQIGPERVISLASVRDAEWFSEARELVITTDMLVTDDAGDQTPWLIFLDGDRAERAWASITAAAVRCLAD